MVVWLMGDGGLAYAVAESIDVPMTAIEIDDFICISKKLQTNERINEKSNSKNRIKNGLFGNDERHAMPLSVFTWDSFQQCS